MKYLVYRINRRTGKKYWRYSKTTDYWTGIKGQLMDLPKKGREISQTAITTVLEKNMGIWHRATRGTNRRQDMRKEYRFKNGLTITSQKFYNGVVDEWKWVVLKDKALLFSFDSYDKAKEFVMKYKEG